MTALERLEPRLDATTGRHRPRPRSPSEAIEPGRPPRSPKRKRKGRPESGGIGRFVRLISGVLTVLAITLLLSGGTVVYLNHIYKQPGPLTAETNIVIPRGEGRLQIASRLESAGVISNRWVFIINHLGRSWLSGDRQDLKAGEYRFAAAAPMSEVLSTVLSGRALTYKLVFPEGMTSQQIVERLRAAPHMTGEIASIPGEGTLMPATYPYKKGASRQSILDWMTRGQSELLAKAWAERAENLPLKTPEEALILASIVEKETGKADERRRVAGVFTNRLRKGMRLQSDPTIIYGIVGGKGSLGRPIYRSEIRKTTPYNTYRIDGLPPTPIANPGKAAIEAVLNPETTTELFFVADGTGGHVFTSTLADHNKAVANWRKVEKEMRANAAAKAQQDKLNAKAADQSASIAGATGSISIPAPAPDQVAANTVAAQPDVAEAVPSEQQSSAVLGQAAGVIPLPSRNPRQ